MNERPEEGVTPVRDERVRSALAAPRWTSPVVGLGISAISARPQVRFAWRIFELVAATGFVLVALSPGSPRHGVAMVAAGLSGLAWLSWILAGDDRRRGLAALYAWSIASGVSATAHSGMFGTREAGLVLVGAACAAIACTYGPVMALGGLLSALAALLITNLLYGAFPGSVGRAVAIGAIGIVSGTVEAQLLKRGRESGLLATAERRIQLADREAQLASERNRLGRELHDVLAHTLGAVSIQITALDSRVMAGDTPEQLRDRLRGLHRLVGEGLDEARDAVRALRDDRLTLETQLVRLSTLHDAALTVNGRSRTLRADEALALYRVVQEALTNAAKHAVGAVLTVTLTYDEREVDVVIANGPSTTASPLATTGGGHGLAGMRARIELVGGQFSAGPHQEGWRVTATVPLR